jgi:hypothetical protein
MLEHPPQRQLDAELGLDSRKQMNGEQRVAADGKEIICYTYTMHPDHFGDHHRKLHLDFVARSNMPTLVRH